MAFCSLDGTSTSWVQIDVAELIKVCRYDDEGTYTIALAVALKSWALRCHFTQIMILTLAQANA